MTHVPTVLKAAVEQRASRRCEYCRLSQAGQEARFHIDHVLPIKHGGNTTLANLCRACFMLLAKGSKDTRDRSGIRKQRPTF